MRVDGLGFNFEGRWLGLRVQVSRFQGLGFRFLAWMLRFDVTTHGEAGKAFKNVIFLWSLIGSRPAARHSRPHPSHCPQELQAHVFLRLVCVFITAGPIIKLCAGGGGQ